MPTLTSAQLQILGYSPDGRRLSEVKQPKGPAAEQEADLHAQIEEWCRAHRCLPVHSRMDRATTTAAGVPDFIIALPGGLTLWVEAKAKKGKLRPEQAAWLSALRSLGHQAAVVWSFPEFLQVVELAASRKAQ